jgi:hypothetical protein
MEKIILSFFNKLFKKFKGPFIREIEIIMFIEPKVKAELNF